MLSETAERLINSINCIFTNSINCYFDPKNSILLLPLKESKRKQKLSSKVIVEIKLSIAQ